MTGVPYSSVSRTIFWEAALPAAASSREKASAESVLLTVTLNSSAMSFRQAIIFFQKFLADAVPKPAHVRTNDRLWGELRGVRKFFGGQAVKKLFLPGMEGIQGGDSQRFAEPPGPGAKDDFSALRQEGEIFGFVRVYGFPGTQIFKGLHHSGQFRLHTILLLP
jgi:hypothetical protein